MRQFLRSCFILFMLGALAAAGFAAFSFQQYESPTHANLPVNVVVARGTPVKQIITQLEEARVIPPLYQIALPLWLSKDYENLKAGEYAFTQALSPKEVFAKLRKGDVVTHKITIPEGWESRQVRALLMADARLSGELPLVIPEGSVLPETYVFLRGDARADVLKEMQEAMNKALQHAWEKRAADLPYASPEEALIMASIIERETGHKAERARVAAVFINRLRANMRLQSDPTAMYGVEQEDGPQDRKPRAADIARDTPWNTYTRDGLPPTPIANPGAEALEAAVKPMKTNEYYFVATGDGGHYFARSLREHNNNVIKYRRAMRSQKQR